MIRICPDRDAECPWGLNCPYVLDRYSCKPGNYISPDQRARWAATARERSGHLSPLAPVATAPGGPIPSSNKNGETG